MSDPIVNYYEGTGQRQSCYADCPLPLGHLVGTMSDGSHVPYVTTVRTYPTGEQSMSHRCLLASGEKPQVLTATTNQAPYGLESMLRPGLGKSVEEIGELIEVLTMLLDVEFAATSGPTEVVDDVCGALLNETADVMAALGFFARRNGFDGDQIALLLEERRSAPAPATISSFSVLAAALAQLGTLAELFGKVVGCGGAAVHWDGYDLDERLLDGMVGALDALGAVTDWYGLDLDLIEERVIEKVRRFTGWADGSGEAAVR